MNAKAFYRYDLAVQYMLLSFPVFLIVAILVGSWVSLKIENGIAARLGGVAGLYVESIVAKHLQTLNQGGDLGVDDRRSIELLIEHTPLGQKIEAFKVWGLNGRVVYSQDKSIVGKTLPVSNDLAEAYAGNIHSELSRRPHKGQMETNGHMTPLFETYVPIRAEGTGNVIAVAEFYQATDEVMLELNESRQQSWIIVALVFAVTYLLLAGLVKKGSNTIVQQREKMQLQLEQLTELHQQNLMLTERIRRAATRATELNENFLKRIAADMHDGPAQDLALGLMKFNNIGMEHANGHEMGAVTMLSMEDFHSISGSMKAALKEIRQICSGLIVPEIATLPIGAVAARAVRDYERMTSVSVEYSVPEVEFDAPLPVKICLYRVLQESLSNGFKHAQGLKQSVNISAKEDRIRVLVSDQGQGFDKAVLWDDVHLGLKGMRERVEILGGSFDIQGAPGLGTTVEVWIPIYNLEENHD